jgi:hypothetical protein
LVPCAWAASTIVFRASSVNDLLAASVMSLRALQGPVHKGRVDEREVEVRHLVEVEGPGNRDPVGVLVDAEVANQIEMCVGWAAGDLAGAESGVAVLGAGRGRAEDAEGEQQGKDRTLLRYMSASPQVRKVIEDALSE